MTVGAPSTRVRERADERLAVWERRMSPVILVAAILPIIVGLAGRRSGPAVWVDLASWLVFVIDLVVHIRLRPHHLRSKIGVFDVVIVVLTAPWYLLPGLDPGKVLSLVRLARLGRVFLVSTHSRRLQALARRLGTAALSSVVLMMTCAAVVYTVEPDTSGYDTFGDAMWWALVTFSTVGYGDYFPVTTGGRIAAVLLMLGGIALIGSLAGSLGSFFGTAERDETSDALPEPTTRDLLDEVRALRAEVADLRAVLGSGPTPAESHQAD